MKPSFSEDDTITAIATPIGEGGLAVLRISGREAIAIADKVFRGGGLQKEFKLAAAPSHTVHYGHLFKDSQAIDEVLVTVMRAPRTFTREDVVEISCHGGVFVARQILDAVLSAGARLAHPGEFSRRAFLSGRIDLTQAEAIADLIHARTELALAAANEQLAGSLGRRVNGIRDELMNLLAHIEAHIDFPEEDIAPATRATLENRLTRVLESIDALLRTVREGQVLRRGIRIAILGRPNAGKSSLLNQLLRRERAIVSPEPGTTRDTIEETANVRGIPVVFVDTAGLRDSLDQIEQEGIRRSRAAASQAELLLHVLDTSEPLDSFDRSLLTEFAARPRLLVLNKTDLPRRMETIQEKPVAGIPISCATGEGIEALKSAIADKVWSGRTPESSQEVPINARHEDALRRASMGIERVVAALRRDESLEFVALDLRLAVQAVGEVVGKTTTEDLLDTIFSEFCLGK